MVRADPLCVVLPRVARQNSTQLVKTASASRRAHTRRPMVLGCDQLDPTDVTVAARDGELAGVEQLHIPGWRRLRQQGRRLGLASMVDPPKRWAVTQRSDADQQHIDRSAIAADTEVAAARRAGG